MRVLVTRPEPGASKTASLLREMGHDPVVLPLSRTVPIEPADPADAAGFDAMALTSTNAILHAPDGFAARYSGLLCFCVGEKTGEATADAGMTKVISAGGDVDALVALIADALPKGSQILYPCGKRRRPALEGELGKRGYAVTALETYRTEPVDYPSEDAASLLGDRPLDVALAYSRYGAERLSALAESPSVAALFGATRVFCLSDQVADGLSDSLRERAETSASPDEDALLALLGRVSKT